MLIKTHLLITLFFVLLLIDSIKQEYKFVFVLVAFITTYMPDIDTKFSAFGKRKPLRIIQFFIKHRGVIHSFTFLILITLIFVLFLPIVSLGFFLGYSLHLFADSLSLAGIRPFYPLKKRVSGKIRTGGKTETLIFTIFLLIDLGLLIWKISDMF